MAKKDYQYTMADKVRSDMYGMESMKWYGWGSPLGLGIGVGALLSSVGLFLWLLHVADIIH